MTDPNRQIYIDNRMESYDGYVPDDWSAKAFGAAKGAAALDDMLVDLVMAWRTIAYTASMPAVLIKTVRAATLAYARFVSPNASIVAFADGILAKLSRKVPELIDDRRLRDRLTAEIVTTTAEYRNARAGVTPEMPIEPLWNDFLSQDAFAMSVWSSQRVCYVAFYNAYEAFLVDCAKQVLGTSRLRATDKAFKEWLRTGFGIDILQPCWTHDEVNNARLIRHALSHAGGRETAELKQRQHGIKVVNGILQIVPHDNHNLLRRLRNAVDSLVAVAAVHPKFAGSDVK